MWPSLLGHLKIYFSFRKVVPVVSYRVERAPTGGGTCDHGAWAVAQHWLLRWGRLQYGPTEQKCENSSGELQYALGIGPSFTGRRHMSIER